MGEMHHALVDTNTAGTGLGNHALYALIIAAVDIQSQRLRLRVDMSNHLLHVLVFEDRQQRAKNFFLHDQCIFTHLIEQGGRHHVVFQIHLSAHEDLCAALLRIAEQSR